MTGVKQADTARPCALCIINKFHIHLLETADKGSGAEMDGIYSSSGQLHGQYVLFYKDNNRRESRENDMSPILLNSYSLKQQGGLWTELQLTKNTGQKIANPYLQ